MLKGGVGAAINPKPISLDDKTAFAKEAKEDRKNWKGKQPTPKRNPVAMVTKNCPRCNQPVTLFSNELGSYSFNAADINSQLPLYRCSNCA